MRVPVGLLALLLVPASLLAARKPPPPHPDHGPAQRPVAILYSDEHFQGPSYEIYPGDNVSNLGDIRFRGGGKMNDRVSSIRVFGGMRLHVFSDADYRGDRLVVDSDISDLGRLRRTRKKSWDDTISSVRAIPPLHQPAPPPPPPPPPRRR